MATVGHKIHEHDVVRLQRRVGRWPEGQQGTVAAEKGHWKLIEIADDQGVMLDCVSAAEADLDVFWSPRN